MSTASGKNGGQALLEARGLVKSYRRRRVVDDVYFCVEPGEIVGLLGPNGAGKTTCFRMIVGLTTPNEGEVWLRGRECSRLPMYRRARMGMGYLPQEPQIDESQTLLESAMSTFDHVRGLEQRVADVAERLAEHHDTDQLDDLMAEYDELVHRLEAAGGYRYETVEREVLGGVGFSPDDYGQPIGVLSGGQKCRAALAQLLMQEADLLLLDEPTNHLDIEATRFLEKFLAGYHGAAVIISHDRYLLDRVVDKIADLDEKRITVYPCGYSDYAEAKRLRKLTAQREFDKQQEWVNHQREYAERVKADKSRAKQSRGRLKNLANMERRGDILDRPDSAPRKMAIQFTPSRRAGDMVLRCENVRKAFGDVVLFDNFNLEVYRGEKIGIIGPNGVGKTTLLKMAMRHMTPDAGEVRLFETLDVGYYDQEHADLDLDHTVIDEIQPHRTVDVEGKIRSYLARFLFRDEDVFKRVGDLSGGEQSRVTLAKLVWRNPQVLILDEPTNHLDIPAREVLEEALISFPGAILLVSHDRYFLNRVVNRLLVLPERTRYEIMDGNWSTYEERVARQEAAEREAAAAVAANDGRRARRRGPSRDRKPAKSDDTSPYASWSLKQLEETIMEREDHLSETEKKFADPDVYKDADRARALRGVADTLRAELADLNAAWEGRAE